MVLRYFKITTRKGVQKVTLGRNNFGRLDRLVSPILVSGKASHLVPPLSFSPRKAHIHHENMPPSPEQSWRSFLVNQVPTSRTKAIESQPSPGNYQQQPSATVSAPLNLDILLPPLSPRISHSKARPSRLAQPAMTAELLVLRRGNELINPKMLYQTRIGAPDRINTIHQIVLAPNMQVPRCPSFVSSLRGGDFGTVLKGATNIGREYGFEVGDARVLVPFSKVVEDFVAG